MTIFADPMCDVLDSLTNSKNKSYIPISGKLFISSWLSRKFGFKDDFSYLENKIQVQTFIKLELVGFEKHQSWEVQSAFASATIEYLGQKSNM